MNGRDIRKKLNMTQAEFSRLTNIPMRTLQGWEYEERKAPDYVISLLEENLRLKGLLKNEDNK